MNFPFDKEIILENSLTLLSPLRLSDIDNLLQVATSNKDLLQFSPAQIHSNDLLKQYIDKSLNDRNNKSRYPFSIFDKSKNAYAESTSFLHISNADNRIEIGATWIGTEYQKTGLNRNCKVLLLAFAFDKLSVARVEFKTDERNLVSRKAIEKIGGKFEGILRSHTLMLDGFRRNTVCYSILKNEWTDLKPTFI